ncbi:hypothetical protein F4604DRAFT_1769208 [Suillus subluteus]|nr:hypothetical protein F4604DRAFT_1769156 [Suillus subluteus]KAG1871697.1 hypothetical protein F4604DRAFT_1769208 [Suillus subluteus]
MIGSGVSEEGTTTHALHFYAIDVCIFILLTVLTHFALQELQPLDDGNRALPMLIVAGKVSRSNFALIMASTSTFRNTFLRLSKTFAFVATIHKVILAYPKLLYLLLQSTWLCKALSYASRTSVASSPSKTLHLGLATTSLPALRPMSFLLHHLKDLIGVVRKSMTLNRRIPQSTSHVRNSSH